MKGRVTIVLTSEELMFDDAKAVTAFMLRLKGLLTGTRGLPPMHVQAAFESSASPAETCEGCGSCGGAPPEHIGKAVDTVMQQAEEAKKANSVKRADPELDVDNFIVGKRLSLYDVIHAKRPVLVEFWENGEQVKRAFRVNYTQARYAADCTVHCFTFEDGAMALSDYTADAAKDGDPFVTSKGYKAYKLIAKKKAKV